jgi:hypothetical protein
VFDVISVYATGRKFAQHWNTDKRALALVLAGLLAGCSTLRYGGAPEPSFDAEQDLEQLGKIFGPGDSISQFYANPTVDARNKFITGRLTMMNIRYIQFIRQLTTDRQLLDTAGALLTLGMNIAGASVAATSTKTILAALSAGVTGSKEVVDKNYFFDKTIPALVGQMNAERKKALIPILTGLKADLDDYPFGQAVTDLHNYYFAGTFAGAIQAIQADAAEKEQRQDQIIATLVPLSTEQVASKTALTKAIGTLGAADLPKIQKAIQVLDPKVTPPADLDGATKQLQSYVRGARTPARISEVANAFKSANISVEQ